MNTRNATLAAILLLSASFASSVGAQPSAAGAGAGAGAGAKVTPLLTKPLAGIDGKDGDAAMAFAWFHGRNE